MAHLVAPHHAVDRAHIGAGTAPHALEYLGELRIAAMLLRPLSRNTMCISRFPEGVTVHSEGPVIQVT